MKLDSILTVNGAALPTPTAYEVSREDIDGDGTVRSESARLRRDRIRAGVYVINVSWENLTLSEATVLTSALSPAEFTVQFFDLTTCSYRSAQFYASGMTSAVTTRGEMSEKMRVSYSCTLTEF